MIQEQARLLAAYHHVGSMRAPRWVKKEVYTYMEWYAQQQNYDNACAVLNYDQEIPAIRFLGSREEGILAYRFRHGI